MRCPKCHYISFESGDRCRNCGYEFSLSADVTSLDLPIQPADAPVGPLADFTLGNLDADDDSLERSEPANGRPARAPELPLFAERVAGDAPLVTPPAVPRPPLAVRRSNGLARSRSRTPDFEEQTLDLGLDAPATEGVTRDNSRERSSLSESAAGGIVTASLVRRIAAGLIDVAILLSIQAAVVYLTLRLCGLRVDELAIVPPVPLVAFLLMLSGGYLVSFTSAAGQTIGKMAAGIRVIPTNAADPSARVPVGTAVVRAAGTLVSLLPAGLGFLPALFSPDHRTLHDRLADTRVIMSW